MRVNGILLVSSFSDVYSAVSQSISWARDSSISYDEGLTLETSAFQICHGGNSTFIDSFDKTKFLFHSPTDAVPQFL